MIILRDSKSVTRFFRTKIIPPTLWNACNYVIQFNFTIAHIHGKNNTAADYLSCLEIRPKEKLILRIREDISTTPIELNVQSAGVTEEDQIFYTDDDEETEEQSLQGKKRPGQTRQINILTFRWRNSVHTIVLTSKLQLYRNLPKQPPWLLNTISFYNNLTAINLTVGRSKLKGPDRLYVFSTKLNRSVQLARIDN